MYLRKWLNVAKSNSPRSVWTCKSCLENTGNKIEFICALPLCSSRGAETFCVRLLKSVHPSQATGQLPAVIPIRIYRMYLSAIQPLSAICLSREGVWNHPAAWRLSKNGNHILWGLVWSPRCKELKVKAIFQHCSQRQPGNSYNKVRELDVKRMRNITKQQNKPAEADPMCKCY